MSPGSNVATNEGPSVRHDELSPPRQVLETGNLGPCRSTGRSPATLQAGLWLVLPRSSGRGCPTAVAAPGQVGAPGDDPPPPRARLLLLALARPHRGACLEGVEKALGARGDIQHGLLEGRGVRRRR